MKLVFSLLVTLVVLALIFIVFPRETESSYVQMANTITSNTARKLEKQHQMSLIGSGGAMLDQINEMEMSFKISRPLDMEEARQIIVSSVEEYLHAINSNEAVRPFLVHYPFTPENVKISILSSQPSGDLYYDPLIGVVFSMKGTVFYNTYDPDKKGRYLKGYKEPFGEALELVKRETR